MNIMIAAVGVDPNFGIGGGSAQDAMIVAGIGFVGLLLILAAGRLCGRGHESSGGRSAPYAAPRF